MDKWVRVTEGKVAMFYALPGGMVAVVVEPVDTDAAAVSVYDRDAALWARGHTDDEFAGSKAAKAARNKYGTGSMLRVLRDVRDSFPFVKRWFVDPKTRTKTGPTRVREVR